MRCAEYKVVPVNKIMLSILDLGKDQHKVKMKVKSPSTSSTLPQLNTPVSKFSCNGSKIYEEACPAVE